MRLAVTGVWLALLCSQTLFAQEPINQTAPVAIRQENHPAEKAQSFSGWLADLKRSRTRLSNLGITGGLVITNDFSDDVRGGAQPDNDFDRCLLDVSLAVDGHKLMGWSGGSALVRLHSYIGENGSDYVGDAQGFSNIDDDSHTLLYELWVEQKLPGTNWRTRIGKIDANTLFAAVENSADFLNSSMGYSPTIMKLPTYPDPGLSGNIVFDNGHRAFGFGLYETKGGGSLFLLEGGQRIAFGNDSRVRVALGAWQLRGNLVTHSDIPQALTNGFYMVDELNLRLQPAGQRDRQLAVFLQYGRADAKISSFGNHFGLGLIWPLPLKSDDSLGIGMSLVTLGRSPGLTLDYDSETAIEFFYKHRFKSIFSVSPDFQIIHHPGGVLGRADAVVFTPRLTAVF